jgi:NAD(P)-dependent dehydrogenase (short-subunit alcohol dehydrogenase family)
MIDSYTPAKDLLADRIVLVTGAGDGIGRAAALAYAEHGATVILLGKTIGKLEAVYDQIVAAAYPLPAIYPMHLGGASPHDYDELAATLEREFGRLDGLLHNASILGQRRSIASTTPANWDETLQVNLTAPFLLTRACLPLLQQSTDASIIFTSSSVGRTGRAHWGAYAVSKFGTEGLSQVLADELEGVAAIRVNTLNPGATNTAMRRSAYPGERPDKNPAPEDIMGPYLYLMGPDSKAVNGQALNAQQPKS